MNKDKDINYAEAILKLRVKLNISQEKLAEMLDVAFESVNRWENGHFKPTKIQKERLKELFMEYKIDLNKE